MRIRRGGVVTCLLLLTACGTTTQQRAATGGLTGLAIGAAAGGPVGALIGGGVGAAAGWATPKSADDVALAMLRSTHESGSSPTASGSGQSGTATSGSSAAAQVTPASHSSRSSDTTSLPISVEAAKRLQANLTSEGYYQGPIDGIIGPETQRALANYQDQHGASGSSAPDLATLQMLTGASSDNAVGSTSSPLPSDAERDSGAGGAPPGQDLPPASASQSR